MILSKIRNNKVYALFNQYWFFLVIITSLAIYYHSSINMPLTEDEISAYGIPVLKLNYNNFSTLLPWNFDAQDFFGHPPLNSVYYALVLRIFPAEPQSLRIASLFISIIGLFAFFEIGKAIKSSSLGFALVILWLSHFSFWDNADFIFSDNLFNTLFLLFVLSYVKNSKRGLVVFGIGMILTRETAIVPLIALWVMEATKFKRQERNYFFLFSYLVIAQLSWFLFLWFKTGSSTPVYHSDGFFFEPSFILKTLRYMLYWDYIENYWIITLPALFLGPLKKVLKDYWGFILIPIIFIFGLSTITDTLSRYQMVGVSSWIIFLAAVFYHRERKPSLMLKLFLVLVIGVLFLRNITLANQMREIGSNFQKRTYNCAKKIWDLKLQGKVKVAGWPMYEIMIAYSSLINLSWSPQPSQVEYLHLNGPAKEYDYFASFSRTLDHKARFENLMSKSKHQIIIGGRPNESCSVYRKIK